jgi:hypothetical protein
MRYVILILALLSAGEEKSGRDQRSASQIPSDRLTSDLCSSSSPSPESQATSPPPHIADLQHAHAQSLPYAACWNTNPVGFNYGWHVQQVINGHRLAPSVFLPYRQGPGISATDPRVAQQFLGPHTAAWEFSRAKSLPLILRFNNVPQVFGFRPRLPKVPESIPLSPLVWRMNAGVLDDTPSADTLGPTEIWTEEGEKLAATPYLAAVASRVPEPAWVMFTANNEGFDDAIFRYVDNAGKPSGQTWFNLKWKSLDTLSTLNLRMRDRVAMLGAASDPYSEMAAYYERLRDKHAAFHGGFREKLSSAWQKNFLTTNYGMGKREFFPPDVEARIGPAPGALAFDASPNAYYPGNFQPNVFTDPKCLSALTESIPGWEWGEKRKAESGKPFLRHVFVYLGADDVLAGKRAGVHEPITPERSQALWEWLLWQSRGKRGGTPVLIHWFVGNATMPLDPFLGNPNELARRNETAAQTTQRLARIERARQCRSDVVAWGYPELAGATEEQYAIAPAKACDSICRPAIREFWQRGETIELPAPIGPTQAWFSVVKLDEKYLVHCWTPCRLGVVTLTIPGVAEPVQIDMTGRSSTYRIGKPPANAIAWEDIP